MGIIAACGGWRSTEYKLTIDGDKLKGKGEAEFVGEKREWDIEGKRQKNDK